MFVVNVGKYLGLFCIFGWEISKDIDIMGFITIFASPSKKRMFNV